MERKERYEISSGFSKHGQCGELQLSCLVEGMRLQAEGFNNENKYNAFVINAINAISGQTLTNSYFDADLKDLFIVITAFKNVQLFMVQVPQTKDLPAACVKGQLVINVICSDPWTSQTSAFVHSNSGDMVGASGPGN